MKPYFICSSIFNMLHYALTALGCIALLPTLLFPRAVFLFVVRGYVRTNSMLEKYILGLTYEVRGQEHLPKDGSYIVAAKHQSAYETLKLHILFKDPAIVLKKELLKIPLWGWYLAKSDVIAIDRSSPKAAIKSIQDGTKHIAKQGRPIIIFPQGTRVSAEATTKEKPYKIGIVRMQDAANIPIIPMALNTGIFQPRHSWCKKSGRVIFEFLPPIMPSNNASDTLKKIETAVESKSNQLMDEARAAAPNKSRLPILAAALLIIYSLNWFIAANITKNFVTTYLADLSQNPAIADFQTSEPKISGFPLKIKLALPQQNIKTINGEELSIDSISAESWPFINMPISIKTGAIKLSRPHWSSPLNFNSLDAEVKFNGDILTINNAALNAKKTQIQSSGNIDFAQNHPNINLVVKIINYAPLLTNLVSNNIVKPKPALLAGMALQALQKDNVVRTTITSQDNKIYLGPIKIIEL